MLITLLVVAGTACGRDHIPVRNSAGDLDHNREELEAAVAGFVGSGRTLAGFRELTFEVESLAPGMDASVAALAERTLVFLALDPLEHTRALGPADQTAHLAGTLWPFATKVSRIDGESAADYVRRVCAGAFVDTCGAIAPEFQAEVLGNEVIARLARRARTAMARCEDCETPAWQEAAGRWTELERQTVNQRWRLERDGALTPFVGPRVSVAQ